MRAGIAIKPGTDVKVLYEIFDNGNKDEVPEVCLNRRDPSSTCSSNSVQDGARNDSGAGLRRAKVHARHDAQG